MSVSRKRSGFVNDTRAYCYPNCNLIPKTINVFPSISACKNTTHQNCYSSSSQVNDSIHLGDTNNQNMNIFQNYNNRISKYI
jgi:hypothetical protein